MSDLSLVQVIAMGAGAALVLLGLAGLVPVALLWHGRSKVYMRGLEAALASAGAFIRPWAPQPAPMAREPAATALSRQSSGTAQDDLALAADELMAQLFAIRMVLSDVTEEVQSVRKVLDEQGMADQYSAPAIDLSGAA